MKKTLPAIASIAAVVAMCAFIFFMSAQGADDSDALSLGVAWHIVSFIVPGYDQMPAADQLHWQQMLNHPVRKTAHFLEYAALGALTMNMLVQIMRVKARPADVSAATPKLRKLAIAAWAFATAYAATDEVHQMFVPGRSGMGADVLLDSCGALVGVLIATLAVFGIIRRKRKKPDSDY